MAVRLDEAKKRDLVAYWARGSFDDLASAREIAVATTRYHVALFYAHLAVEKAFKAALVEATGEHAPYTHNLLHLVAKLGWQPEAGVASLLAEINDFNLEGRYPDEKESFRKKATKAYAEAKLKDVEEVIAWISSNSRSASSNSAPT